MKLEQIYKAAQCTDLNDVEAAIANVWKYIINTESEQKECKAGYRRLYSLLKKKKQLQ